MNSSLKTVTIRTLLAKKVVSLSPSVSMSSKVYELRTYAIKPPHMADYLNLTKEKFSLRTAYSKLNGFWVAEIGGLNETIHLWEYDSLSQRASVRAALATDEAWREEYLSKALPYFEKQHNQLVTADTPIATTPIKEGGAYQLCTFRLKTPEAADPKSQIRLVEQVTAIQEELLKEGQRGKLIALLRTQIGDQNLVYQLWNYKHIDEILACKGALDTHPAIKGNQHRFLESSSSKVLIPLPQVSPLM